MKKIPSLFQRNYNTDRLVRDEVVPGSEWVLAGEGVATIKLDGTACMVRRGRLFKRYDRKVTGAAKRRGPPFAAEDCKTAPPGWEACEDAPNAQTGHWPGWLPVGNGPEDQWHRDAWANVELPGITDGTYELLGPRVQGNPYGLTKHVLCRHGGGAFVEAGAPPRTFDGVRQWLAQHYIEGIVWHHPDGRMVKIKRRDFGLPWPDMSAKREEAQP